VRLILDELVVVTVHIYRSQNMYLNLLRSPDDSFLLIKRNILDLILFNFVPIIHKYLLYSYYNKFVPKCQE